MAKSSGQKWLIGVGCGCGALILGVLAVCGGLVAWPLLALKSNVLYGQTMKEIQAHPEVVEAFGGEIGMSLVPNGSINVTNDSGEADFYLDLWGDEGEGRVHVVATRSGGVWDITDLVVEMDTGETWVLRPVAPGGS